MLQPHRENLVSRFSGVPAVPCSRLRWPSLDHAQQNKDCGISCIPFWWAGGEGGHAVLILDCTTVLIGGGGGGGVSHLCWFHIALPLRSDGWVGSWCWFVKELQLWSVCGGAVSWLGLEDDLLFNPSGGGGESWSRWGTGWNLVLLIHRGGGGGGRPRLCWV